MLVKTKITTSEEVSCLSLSDIVFIMLLNIKMPTLVGILTFMSRINFVLSRLIKRFLWAHKQMFPAEKKHCKTGNDF